MTLKMTRAIVILIILIFSSACQQTTVPYTPTTLPIQTPITLQDARPTLTPRAVEAIIPTSIPTDLPTDLPSPVPATIAIEALSTLPPLPFSSPAAASTLDPKATASGTPVLTRLPAANTFTIGQSVEGRDILAWRFGSGSKTLLLIGGIHTGFESNTVMLINALVDHFEGTPVDVLPGMSIILIPVLNPDGLVRGRNADGRFNGNNVDLNRNWGCDWSAEAYWKQEKVNPGVQAFSEPETQALQAFIGTIHPTTALFYHSAANGIFEGTCNDVVDSAQLAAVLGDASGYPYGKPFTAYTVSGTESNWADGQGILSADVELAGTRDAEFERNLRGIMAVQCWITGDLDKPQCK
jgi:hypothetical protein